VLAIVAVESHYQTNAVNRQSGAVGLMQVLPRFHQQMVNAVGGDKQLLQIAPNIRVGSQIIAEYLGREGGNLKDALGRYLGVGGADIYFGRVRNLMQHFDQIITNAEPG
jgi:soluble lytic murein transglycosylase-like protein